MNDSGNIVVAGTSTLTGTVTTTNDLSVGTTSSFTGAATFNDDLIVDTTLLVADDSAERDYGRDLAGWQDISAYRRAARTGRDGGRSDHWPVRAGRDCLARSGARAVSGNGGVSRLGRAVQPGDLGLDRIVVLRRAGDGP